MSTSALRVIDFGRVSPLRSQTLWHAIAYGVSAGAPPTLSLMQPDAPYVSIGFHRRLEEIDQVHCGRVGLPVYRRMVGGGPVYLDDGQLLFQITLPLDMVPAVRARAVRDALAPAVEAFRAVGIDASLEEAGDVVVGDRKISGHGAGQIEQAVVVVGNLISRFDHAAAARTVDTPDQETRDEFETLMRRYLLATPADPIAFASAVTRAYGSALGLVPEVGGLNGYEEEKLTEVDGDFLDEGWLRGSPRIPSNVWHVKVKAGVLLVRATDGVSHAQVSVAGGRIVRARLTDPELNGAAALTQDSLAGLTVSQGRAALSALGSAGDRLGSLLHEVERVVRA
jgi:lipoate---protein ligase